MLEKYKVSPKWVAGFVLAVTMNVVTLAYTYGQLTQRVTSLEEEVRAVREIVLELLGRQIKATINYAKP